MTKCVTCHGILQKTETKCFLCGTEVPPEKQKVSYQERFVSVVKVALAVSSAITVLSLFTDWVPSFVKCFIATAILGLVKNSATQMWENRQGS